LKIVKLHTTQSTNDYLKDLFQHNELENLTVITSQYQTQGRGQRGNYWHSESGKNLLFSLLIKHKTLDTQRHFLLNQVISLALWDVLHRYVPQVKIKWPNDIMADAHKIAGILIENTLSGSKIKHSIIGVGINVNQVAFPKDLPQATSLKKLLNTTINLDKLLDEIVHSIRKNYQYLLEDKIGNIQKQYVKNLYLLQQTCLFKNREGKSFTGKITGINTTGKIQLDTDTGTEEFDFKELVFPDKP